METLVQKWRDNKDTVSQELRQQSLKHANRPHSRLVMLPDDHEPGSGRGIERRLEMDPKSTPKSIRGLVGIAEPHFEAMMGSILDDRMRREQFRMLGEATKSREHASVITLHESDPVDAPVAQALAICVLNELGYRPRFGLVISKIMAHLGYELMPDTDPIPTTNLLRQLGNVYLSFPRTESIKNSNIQDDVISLYNANLRHLVNKDRKAGDYVLAGAPSGTLGKPNALDPTITDIAGVSEATTKLFGGLVLPIALRVGQTEPFLDILPIRTIGSLQDMDSAMLELCRTHEDLSGQAVNLNYQGITLSA